MNSNYPDPAYQAELEKEAMLEMLKNLQEENKRLKGTVRAQDKMIEKQNVEMAQLKQRLCRDVNEPGELRRHTLDCIPDAVIENIHDTVRRDDYYEGIVITPPLKYEGKNEQNRDKIHSYNWIYSQKLGLVRSMNKDKISMKFTRFYYFKVNDERVKRRFSGRRKLSHMEALRATKSEKRFARRSSRIQNGKIVFQLFFEFDASLLYDDKTVYLEDEFLNRINLNGKMMSQIFQMAGTSKVQGTLIMETKVGLKEKFLEKFQQDPNNPIFEVIEVRKIKFESGREVEAKKTGRGSVHYNTLRS